MSKASISKALLGFVLVAGLADSAVADKVTFTKDVLPILQENCQDCHRPTGRKLSGMVAPMSLMTYQEVRPWAKAIARAVENNKMPPWHATAETDGVFHNERTLTDEEVATIQSWVERRAPRGHEKDAPAPVEFSNTGWNIGEPDQIIEWPESFFIEDEVEDSVYNDQIEIGGGQLPKDRWIKSVEFKPGSEVVHHIIGYARSIGASQSSSVMDPPSVNLTLSSPALDGDRVTTNSVTEWPDHSKMPSWAILGFPMFGRRFRTLLNRAARRRRERLDAKIAKALGEIGLDELDGRLLVAACVVKRLDAPGAVKDGFQIRVDTELELKSEISLRIEKEMAFREERINELVRMAEKLEESYSVASECGCVASDEFRGDGDNDSSPKRRRWGRWLKRSKNGRLFGRANPAGTENNDRAIPRGSWDSLGQESDIDL